MTAQGCLCVKNVETYMTPVIKNSLALALVGTITAAAASPTLARTWRPAAAAGAGFVAGAAAATYGPAYQAYAYAPGQAPAPGSYGYGNYRSDGSDGISGCATVGNYGGKTDYGAC